MVTVTVVSSELVDADDEPDPFTEVLVLITGPKLADLMYCLLGPPILK